LANTAWAQDPFAGFVNHIDLTVEDGLPSNTITCFKRDGLGFMWIGTTKGLARYDGSSIRVYQNDPKDSLSLSGNYVKTILIEGDSIMWIGTAEHGLNRFRFSDQTFKRYFPKYKNKDALPYEEIISLMLDRDETLWLGFHRAGLGKYHRETDSFEHIELPTFEIGYDNRQINIVKKIEIDRENPDVLWLYTLSALLKYNKTEKSFETFQFKQSFPNDDRAPGGYGYGIQATDGNIYIPSNRKGIMVFNPKLKTWSNYNEKVYNKRNHSENSYSKIQQLSETTFWLGSYSRGIALLDTEKGYIIPIGTCIDEKPDQVCKLRVTCMDMDTKNGHWIGTGNGMRLYTKYGNQFSTVNYDVEESILKGRTSVVAIYHDKNKGFYFGGYAGEGVYHFNQQTKKTSLIKPPAPYVVGKTYEMFYLRKILPYNDTTLLVLSDNALFKLFTNTSKLETVETGISYKTDYFFLHRIMAHPNGTFYITTRHSGIYILDKDLKMKQHLLHKPKNPNSLISSNYIYEITSDPDGKVWVGTEDGFSVYDPENSSFSNFDYRQRIDSVAKLKIIFSITLAPDSSLWFIDGRAHGMYLNYPYLKPYEFKPIETGPEQLAEKLLNNYFTTDGKTIICTENGLSIEYPSGEIKRFTKRHGLPNARMLSPIAELSDGRIAIGTGSKIALFYPDSLIDIPRAIPMYLSSFSVFNKIQQDNLSEIVESGLELSYLENFFSFNLGMINYDNPDDYTLSYRLAGLNNEWLTDNERKAVFTNVPDGSYVFEARLQNKDDHTIVATLSFPLTIIPPFWRRTWFRALSVIIVLLIISGFYFMHIQRIRKEAALKTKFNKQIANMELNTLRAQMNPHFLFNSLNSIRHKIISNEPEEADKYLVKFSRLVRQVLNNSRKQLITLRDELETLELYVNLESSRFEHKFKYITNIADDIDTQKLSIPPILIQPFVENAIWHGLMQKEEGGSVILSITKSDSALQIVIEDDGIGRKKATALKSKTAQKRQSMGIEITGNRMEIIEKLYDIPCSSEIIDLFHDDGTSAGTRIVLTLPLFYDTENSNN
jgi:hypothetical protein